MASTESLPNKECKRKRGDESYFSWGKELRREKGKTKFKRKERKRKLF